MEGVKVARDREGEFCTNVLCRYKRREGKIDKDILTMFIKGISTRGMKKITQRLLGGEGYSAGTVSNINKELTEEMRAWMCAPIKDKIIYLFLDGLNLPVRRFVVSKESLLVAVGITQDGQRKILGLALGDREKAGSWREFLKDLKKRGLDTNSVKLGIMDACRG